MIKLVYSNKTEQLLKQLTTDLDSKQQAGVHPLTPVELIVPNRNMETYVRLELAQTTGVAANLRFQWLNRYIENIVFKASHGKTRLVNLDKIEASILAALFDDNLLHREELLPVLGYLQGNRSHNPIIGGKILDRLQHDEFETTFGFGGSSALSLLEKDGIDLRRAQLASRLAFLFQEYSLSRPEMLSFWREESRSVNHYDNLPFADPTCFDPSLAPTLAWQRALWQAVFGREGVLTRHPPEDGGCWTTMDMLAMDDRLFEEIGRLELPPAYIFGISYVARIFQLLFARLGAVSDLYIYCLNPCAEFWEDVETHREYYYRLDRELDRRSRRIWEGKAEDGLEEDPFGLFEADNPALLYWGRPGREHVRLLGELTDCDFTGVFADPMVEGKGLLHQLQHDILTREPEQSLKKRLNDKITGDKIDDEEVGPADRHDDTIKIVAAPSVRREVEWVADEIWHLMNDNNKSDREQLLRFSDIAIIVNSDSRDLYLPQIESVFGACHNLPVSISDLPGTYGSRFAEAMNIILHLPFGRLSRAEMLSIMSHPAVIGHLDNITPDDMAAICHDLGIVFGADHSDHAGTYIDEDIYNWDQGIRRLALGAFMTGEKSGDERCFETETGRSLVEESSSGSDIITAARFNLLARSLLADARFVREKKITLSEWTRFYRAQVDTYFHVKTSSDEQERLALLRCLDKLETMDLGTPVSGRTAAELAARAINTLEGRRGHYLAEGVIVSSFLPMRAIPFRIVFLLGLGEGQFPASGLRDALDLRAARRRAGDVDPAERDRYMFLETLLCTREKLYISYVQRDEQTGDVLQPSAVVQELLHILQLGYLKEENWSELHLNPPLSLRRYDDLTARDTFFDEARREGQVKEISLKFQSNDPSLKTERPGKALESARKAAGPEAWNKLSEILILPGDAPQNRSISLAAKSSITKRETYIKPHLYLPLSALRRFLECPMQGWASAMLGLSEFEEDYAEKEEEDFTISRPLETVLLREAFLQAVSQKNDPAAIYRKKAIKLRLAGKFPAGSLGDAVVKRHLEIIAGWQALLTELTNSIKVPTAFSTVCFGHSDHAISSKILLDPLTLELKFKFEEGEEQSRTVFFSGRTEGLFNNNLFSFSLLAKKPPERIDKTAAGNIFRYLLRGLIDHLSLSAANKVGRGERTIALLFAAGKEDAKKVSIRLRPMGAEKAVACLTSLATDLLQGSHAYLLPCEAVFAEYYKRNYIDRESTDIKSKGNSAELQDQGGKSITFDGESIRSLIAAMAGNEWTSFSSLWGPVPSPAGYEPPSADKIVQMVTRRFKPILEDIIAWEDF